MDIIWTIIIGFFAGLLARFIMPGKDSAGFILTTILGIIGAFLGRFVGQTMGWAQPGEPIGFFTSVMGALLVLFVVKMFRKPASGGSL